MKEVASGYIEWEEWGVSTAAQQRWKIKVFGRLAGSNEG